MMGPMTSMQHLSCVCICPLGIDKLYPVGKARTTPVISSDRSKIQFFGGKFNYPFFIRLPWIRLPWIFHIDNQLKDMLTYFMHTGENNRRYTPGMYLVCVWGRGGRLSENHGGAGVTCWEGVQIIGDRIIYGRIFWILLIISRKTIWVNLWIWWIEGDERR